MADMRGVSLDRGGRLRCSVELLPPKDHGAESSSPVEGILCTGSQNMRKSLSSTFDSLEGPILNGQPTRDQVAKVHVRCGDYSDVRSEYSNLKPCRFSVLICPDTTAKALEGDISMRCPDHILLAREEQSFHRLYNDKILRNKKLFYSLRV